jgi:hypothetical protein
MLGDAGRRVMVVLLLTVLATGWIAAPAAGSTQLADDPVTAVGFKECDQFEGQWSVQWVVSVPGTVPYHVVAHANPPNPSFFIDRVMVQEGDDIPAYLVDPTIQDASLDLTFWRADSDPSTAETRTPSMHLDLCVATKPLPTVQGLKLCDGTLRLLLGNKSGTRANAEFQVVATGLDAYYTVAPSQTTIVNVGPAVPNPVDVYAQSQLLQEFNIDRQPTCATDPSAPKTTSVLTGGGPPKARNPGITTPTTLPPPSPSTTGTTASAPSATTGSDANMPNPTQLGTVTTDPSQGRSLATAAGIGVGTGALILVGLVTWRLRRRRPVATGQTDE